MASSGYERVVYLGSGPLKGLAHESSLKLLELTAGEIVTYFESPLGFRHGPKSILDDRTLAVFYISGDPYTRKYDLDLLAELKRSMRPGSVIAIAATDAGTDDPSFWHLEGLEGVEDAALALPFVVVAQLLGPLLLARPRLHTGQSVPQPGSESRGTGRIHPFSTEEESMMYLGVDGGGTKTALCLVDEGGRVAAQTQAPSCYYFTEGIDLVGRVLQEGIDEVCDRASVKPAEIRYAFFGLPTYGEVSGDVPTLDAVPGEILGHGRYACDNDTVCGWAGSLGGVDGINVVSGTGSITYGERLGRGARVGGWGDLFGDEGSAYWISIKGLNAFTRMSDGRLPVGPLHEALRTHLELAADLDLVDVVLNRWQGGRSEIAALSRVVVEAAESRGRMRGADPIRGGRRTRRTRRYHQTRPGFRLRRRGFQSPTPAVYSAYVPSSRTSERPSTHLHDGYELEEAPVSRLLSGRRSTRRGSRANHWIPRRSAN